MADCIQCPDADYQALVANLVTYATTKLTAGDLTPVTTTQAVWSTGFAAHIAAKNPDSI